MAKSRDKPCHSCVYWVLMDESHTPFYRRCINCGAWIEEGSRIADRFCSIECSLRYKRCGNCGAYYHAAGDKGETLCPVCGYRQEQNEEGGT